MSFYFSCELINPEADIPSYIYVDSILLQTDYNKEGSASHKIVDCWLYINDKLIGINEMPCKFPVIASGNVNISIYPGIKNNGISATRVKYPFYDVYKTNIKLYPDSITYITALTKYSQYAVFEWIEDFENIGHSLTKSTNSQTDISIINDSNVFEGNASAFVYLDKNQTFFEAYSPDFTNLPKNGTAVYLEMNYKSNQTFFIGLYANNRTKQRKILYINPRKKWNKIYIDLSNDILDYSIYDNINIFIGIKKDSTGYKTYTYFDNIKLIHF